MARRQRRWPAVIALAAGSIATARCTTREAVLELQGSVMYDKPSIERLSYTVTDSRGEGGPVAIRVEMTGDPGLDGSFDITPGIVDGWPLSEVTEGAYVGEFSFPADTVGGPYTVRGRLVHPAAGEATRRHPDPLTIGLPRGPSRSP
jgi:hypothetical protein